MIKPTEDPTVNIVNQNENYVEYEDINGKKWGVYGKCIACGLCETKPTQIPSVIIENNRRITSNGIEETWSRKLIWSAEPGIAGACVEEEFENRKDIPMSPDIISSIKECTLKGVWINGN